MTTMVMIQLTACPASRPPADQYSPETTVRRKLTRLPAQPDHLAAQRPVRRNTHQVEHDLVRAHMASKSVEDLRAAQPYHEQLGFGDDALDIAAHDRRNVRNVLLDETPVRAEQARQVHVRVVDEQVESLADELLGDRHQRTFAQIVGSRLE